MDVTQALKDAENALRDFIALVLHRNFGDEWVEKCGLPTERIEKWRERKGVEEKRQEGGVVEERLLYYADFYDLKPILKKNWQGDFSEAFGDLRTMEVWLSELEKLRDPDAHRRELLPHQKNLALGIEGEIRSRIIRYRSKQETSESYYPRIESARDNLGNLWVPERATRAVVTSVYLRPGDKLEFVVTARDPMDEALEYGIYIPHTANFWQSDNVLDWVVTKKNVGKNFMIQLRVRSPREFHAAGDEDDSVMFFYEVLPPNRED